MARIDARRFEELLFVGRVSPGPGFFSAAAKIKHIETDDRCGIGVTHGLLWRLVRLLGRQGQLDYARAIGLRGRKRDQKQSNQR